MEKKEKIENGTLVSGDNEGVNQFEQSGENVLGAIEETGRGDTTNNRGIDRTDSGRIRRKSTKNRGNAGNPEIERNERTGNLAGSDTTESSVGEKPETKTVEEILQVSESAPIAKAKRGRKPKKKTEDETREAVLVILMLFDGIATTFVNPNASLNSTEREFIEAPLARILYRMSPDVSEIVEKYTDPVFLLFGLGLWGYRVSTLNKQPKKQIHQKPVVENSAQDDIASVEDFNTNGASPNPLISDLMSYEQ